MKKFSLGIMLALVIVAGAATTVFAQAETPPQLPDRPAGMGTGGRMGNGQEDIADFLGMTVEELQAAREEGKTVADLLEEKGLTEEDLQAALQTAREEALAQAVADGKMTQEQADELLQKMAEREGQGFPAERPDRPADGERPLGAGSQGDDGHLTVFADLLGMTVDEIKAAIQDEGQTLQSLLDSKGITEEAVQTAMQEAMQARLQQAVADGSITQEQADNMLQRMQDGSASGAPGTRQGAGRGGSPQFEKGPRSDV